MTMETVVWTLLPDPMAQTTTDGLAHLSLMFGLRLSGTPTGGANDLLPLTEFRNVRSWPDFPFRLSVRFRLDNGASTTCEATVEPVAQNTLWGELFSGAKARPFVFDRTVATKPLESYPAHLLWRSLREEYARMFAPSDSPDAEVLPGVSLDGEPPGGTDGWTSIDRLVRLVGADAPARMADARSALLRQGVLSDEFEDDPYGWARLAGFHQPFALPHDDEGEAAVGPKLKTPERDFHGLLAALADHPGLMERLGLVRRVTVPLPPILEEGRPTDIQAVPLDHPSVIVDQPFTRCVLRRGRLVLARSNGTEAALYLPLDDTDSYEVVDVDLDAAALGLQAYAVMLAGLPRDREPPRLLAPALRSDGISVVENDRQIAFREHLREALEMDEDLEQASTPGEAITLHADNVLQGYRVDVFDQSSGRWYPLCRRTGRYSVRGHDGALPIDDEGTVCDALTEGVDADGNELLRLHQYLFRWSGWSLVAELTGKMIDTSEQLQDPGPVPDAALPFSSTVQPTPGTLPSLRYGRTYRFRARLVDLAGHSVPFSTRPTSGEPASPPLRYSRYEPVPAPVLVPRRPVTPGESVVVLVVRTDNSDAAAPAPGPTCERHLLAPKASVQLLERHGVLDVAGENRLDPAVYDLLERLDSGVVEGTPDAGAGGTPYKDADSMQLPWPCDPLSSGTALHGLPGMLELLAPWPQGSGWHERFPLRLVVVPGAVGGAEQIPVVDLAARVIRVTVPPAATHTALLSSMLNPGDEDLLALWRWYTESAGRADDEFDELRARVAAGLLAQLTPRTELRLIHAVRCPVVGPEFGRASVERGPGETAYVLADPGMTLHEASTLSVHTEAAWTEYVDDPTQEKPTETPGRAVLRQNEEAVRADRSNRPVPYDEDDASGRAGTVTAPFEARHDVGDTRHRAVRFTPVGVSRFVSYFTQSRKVRLSGTEPERVAAAFVPGTVVVRASVAPVASSGTPADPGPTYTFGRDFVVDDEDGTVARRDASGIPDGAEVLVEFTVPPVTRAGRTITRHVPASTRPPAPAVHSVVPAFQWERGTAGSTLTSTRLDGVVRVYLQRPWCASGEGELLAVRVLGPHEHADTTSAKWATMWGRDPVRHPGSAPVMGYPRPADLLGAVDETVPQGHAMGYPVKYDERRRLWYADVRFQAQNVYQPFVRLRVARLQRHALLSPQDLRLSAGVDAGFVQLPARRQASVSVDGKDATVTVTGPLPPAGAVGMTTRMTAGVQIRGLSSIDDPAQWSTIDTAEATATLALASVTGPIARWEGTLRLPLAPSEGRPQRLLVQEVEEIPSGARGLIPRVSYLDTFTL
ncbi:hypothetical protein I3F58_21525 [Streptomyces sp. MUM 203J]|uniref:hypothetical protein n=1 Tax=Streptomyces sp. MUM 203J TaxID=2791990 RepID=UPI001F046A16|nr:hypothetical protein [Streptomyces sp. MUM 203J]MCH0542094.1 hypothetical protein [Streptomyces sp. MUM 203J]